MIAAYIEPDATTMSKEAIKKIKDVLENYDVLEDYAELVNNIAIKEPGEAPIYKDDNDLPAIYRMYNSDEYVQALKNMEEAPKKLSAKEKMKEALKAALKKEALVVPKATPVDQIKKYQAQGVDVKLDVK